MHQLSQRYQLIRSILCSLFLASSLGAGESFKIEQMSHSDVIKTLVTNCGDCHSEGESFSVASLQHSDSLANEYDTWSNVRDRLSDQSMPPADENTLQPADRESLIHWIHSETRKAIFSQGEKAGPANFRRLNRNEYSNTIRELLDIHINAGTSLPQDIAGGEGFNNASETLIISPIHAEKFLQAATESLEYAAADARSRKRLLSVVPNELISEDEAARQNLHRLTTLAFRRPVEAEEIDGFLTLFHAARADGLEFDDSCFYAMRGVLVSTDFLFLSESIPESEGDVLLPSHEFANRLSYFLTASMPDPELREAADQGRLHEPEEIRRQTLRILATEETHLDDSFGNFVGQWLGTADWGRKIRPDLELNPWIEDHHVSPMRDQPVRIFVEILQENASLLELIDSDWTFLNQQLAEAYNFDRSTLPQKINRNFHHHLIRVPLTKEFQYRSGILGCGAAMGVTSYPHRTSPVLRGTWLLEKFLGVEMPPPPPDVPDLEASSDATQPKTVRAQLELHRANSACASCHDRIDPIGFALENFDVIGRWREQDAGQNIDSSATMEDGTIIGGLEGLKEHMLSNKDQFIRHITQKMLGYALARSLRPSDLCTLEQITSRVIENECKSQELILGIVMSKPFTHKRNPKSE